ncbi:uncharacterized protein LOC110432732 [Sorghum bicolor]|uniref:uncharacterized protein LOC110432732 n=1 Tax=Sorghum bicolor TaxID=4558 RepID=UPI000B42380B|nr:uncharacterized protein LOC110432732 [Sorghum bicolor]|eukprot:XP_021309196.1 uncharacterized protein LOC110432732 [Sorghum bicolor]
MFERRNRLNGFFSLGCHTCGTILVPELTSKHVCKPFPGFWEVFTLGTTAKEYSDLDNTISRKMEIINGTTSVCILCQQKFDTSFAEVAQICSVKCVTVLCRGSSNLFTQICDSAVQR